jgi:arylformamidase
VANTARDEKDASSRRTGKMWRDLTQAELDAAYTPAHYAPNMAHVVSRMEASSAEMRKRLGEPQVFNYGPSPIEKLFYYPTDRPGAPIHIHVHGGAWRERSAESIIFPAESFIKAGIGFAIYDFTTIDKTNGDLRPVLAQVCSGLSWLAHNARKLGGDPERLYVSGFSSGAHLASVAMTEDWSKFGFDKNPYGGAFLWSGMYDLEPVRLCSHFTVALTDEDIKRMSAQRHIDKFNVPVVLVYGYEAPEFQRQTLDFAAALKSARRSVKLLDNSFYNHYELMECFGNPFSPLGRAVIAQALEGE